MTNAFITFAFLLFSALQSLSHAQNHHGPPLEARPKPTPVATAVAGASVTIRNMDTGPEPRPPLRTQAVSFSSLSVLSSPNLPPFSNYSVPVEAPNNIRVAQMALQ